MAISVKDIQEKEFSTQATDGYNVEQVDDFLDEVAEQLSSTIRENLALNGQIKQLEEAVASAKAEKTDLEKKLPDYNENGYFKNLESAMRESLIGAQRIADETVEEANKKAAQAVSDANAQAEKTVSDAQAQAKLITETAQKAVEELQAESERLKADATAYRDAFRKLVEAQNQSFHENEKLFS